MHVSSAGTPLVEGYSCLSMSFGFRCLSFHFFLQWWCLFSWSCVHLSRHCVDSVGHGLNAIVTVQQHGLCVVPFVVHSSVWDHSTEKTVGASGVPSMQDVEKTASELACAGRSNVAASAACRSSHFAATRPVSKNARNCPDCCLY